jgi:hypothetical protein
VPPFEIEVAALEHRARPRVEVGQQLHQLRSVAHPATVCERVEDRRRRRPPALGRLGEHREALVDPALPERHVDGGVLGAHPRRRPDPQHALVEIGHPMHPNPGPRWHVPPEAHGDVDRTVRSVRQGRLVAQRARPGVEDGGPRPLLPRQRPGVRDVDAVVDPGEVPPSQEADDVVIPGSELPELSSRHDAVLADEQLRHPRLVEGGRSRFRCRFRHSWIVRRARVGRHSASGGLWITVKCPVRMRATNVRIASARRTETTRE